MLNKIISANPFDEFHRNELGTDVPVKDKIEKLYPKTFK